MAEKNGKQKAAPSTCPAKKNNFRDVLEDEFAYRSVRFFDRIANTVCPEDF